MTDAPHDAPDVAMTGPMMPLITEQLDAAFSLHKVWLESDRQAALAGLGARVRGLAASPGHAPVGEAEFAALPRLEIISNFGVGYDNVDIAAAARRGIVVTNTPNVLNEEVADTALGLLLCTVRQLPQADRYVRAGKWLEKNFPLSETLRDRTAGIVGLGRIGKAIARRLDAFGVPVVYHARNPQPGVPYRHYPDLVAMARDVDTLILITPGGPATRHLVDAAVLAALGPRGILINVARGSVVDEAALIAALRSRTILAAGLDVFADEPRVPQALIDMEQVVLLPHVGSATHHTRRAMGQLVVDNLVNWFAGKGPLTPVPETPWPRP